jgi:hypothetical protein
VAWLGAPNIGERRRSEDRRISLLLQGWIGE